jgi:hypothetical protein
MCIVCPLRPPDGRRRRGGRLSRARTDNAEWERHCIDEVLLQQLRLEFSREHF